MVETRAQLKEKEIVKLDKDLFNQEMECTAVRVPVKLIHQF